MQIDKNQSRAAVRVYATAVILAAMGLLAGLSWSQSGPWPPTVIRVAGPLATVLYWALLSLAAEAFGFTPRCGRAMVSMSLGVNLASILVLPASMALSIAAGSVLVADLVFHRRGVLRSTFNAAQTTLALGAAAFVLRSQASVCSPGVFFDPLIVFSGFAVFFVINTGLVAGVLSLQGRESVFLTWRQCFGGSDHGISTVAHCLLALSLAILYPQLGFVSGVASIFFFSVVKRAAEASPDPVPTS